MPAVSIKSDEQYMQALEVLDRVGGGFQGVGMEERFLLVSPRQYAALVEAKVVSEEKPKQDVNRGKKTRNPAKP